MTSEHDIICCFRQFSFGRRCCVKSSHLLHSSLALGAHSGFDAAREHSMDCCS